MVKRSVIVSMKKVYIIRKYVPADSISEALKKEKMIKPDDIFLTDYSTTQHLEEISPRKQYGTKRTEV